MSHKNVEFSVSANALSTLNLDQIQSLSIILLGILRGFPAESYQKQGEKLVKQYKESTKTPNGKDLNISELLMAWVYFDPDKLYAISLLLEELRYKPNQRKQTKLPRTSGGITEIGTSVYSVKTFFPNYAVSPSPPSEKEILQEKINKLIMDAKRAEYDDPARALELIDEAIKLAKENNMFYADIFEVRVNLTKEDDEELVRLYETELKLMVNEDDDTRMYFHLYSLAHRFAYKGDKQKALVYLDKAEEIIKDLVYSDKSMAPHPDLEGYLRLNRRVQLSGLYMLRQQISKQK